MNLSSIFEKNNDISKIHKINHSVRAFDILSSFAIDRNPKRTIKSSDVKHFKKLLNIDSLYCCVELLSGSLHQASDASKLYKNANALGCARFIFNDIANFYIDKRNLRDNANSYYYSKSFFVVFFDGPASEQDAKERTEAAAKEKEQKNYPKKF